MRLLILSLIFISFSVFAGGGSDENIGNGGGPPRLMMLNSIDGPGSGSGQGSPGVVLGEDVVDVRLENGDVYDVDYLKDKFGDWVKKEGTLLKLDTRIKIRDVQTAAGEIIAVQ